MSLPEDVKSCCAGVYSSDAVALLLGDSYHPGGAALTRRLAGLVKLRPGHRVADIVSGPGAVQRAERMSNRLGLSDRVRFHVGDAERIPLSDNGFDAVLTECAFCTFTDKATAAGESARILRPGGRIGLADVTVDDSGLPDELSTVAAWVACVADARSVGQYRAILDGAGLATIHAESHDSALVRMLDQVQARVHLMRMTQKERIVTAGINVDEVLDFIDTVRGAVSDGLLGYALIVAEKEQVARHRRPLSGFATS